MCNSGGITTQGDDVNVYLDKITLLTSIVKELEETESLLRKTCLNLQSTIESYNGIINTVTDYIVLTDLNGKILFVNDYVVQSSGFTREELLNNDMLVFISPEDREKAQNDAMLLLKEREEPGEFTLVTKNGTRIPFEINGEVLDKKGIPFGFVFICRDITTRLQTQKVIKNFEERIFGITSNMPGIDFQFCVDRYGNYSLNKTSKHTREFLELDSMDSDTNFNLFLSRIHGEDRNAFIGSVDKARDNKKSWNHIFRYIRPSGNTYWLHGLSIPTIHDDEIVFNGVLLDVSDFKRAEEISRESKEKFSRVFMIVPDAIGITRVSDGYIFDTNTGFEEMIGWKSEDVYGLTTADIKFWDNQDDRLFLKREIEAGREIINQEFEFKRKDGSVRTGVYSARAIQINNELCMVFVLRDITDVKRIESENRILQQQLLHSQKMDAIGQLAGGIAHDFNNILTSIQGNVSLMLMHSNPEDYNYRKLTRIDESIRRGSNITRQLLDFAKVGKYEVKTLSINEFLAKCVRFFVETRRDIEASFNLQDDLFPVEADEGQLEQVLLNLFINAAQAMPAGRVGRICLETANIILQDQEAKVFGLIPGCYVKISVTDNGSGMNRETLARLFEPFYTTKSDRGGTGLGLASAYGIIRNHKGVIKAYSEPGHGSTFSIYLPSTDKRIYKDEQKDDEEPVNGSGCILFIDDEEQILEFANEMLTILGYTVFAASNGHDALALFTERTAEIDLIVMDMIIPGLKGSRLIKKFRKINPDVRIIITSGYSPQGDIQKIMESRCQGFIQKPYKLKDMARLIHEALSSKNI